MTPEFARPFTVNAVGSRGAEITVEAKPAECAALARRLGVVAIAALGCRFSLSAQPGGAVAAEGHLTARLTQDCVVSLEPFETVFEEDFVVRFVPEGRQSEEIDPEEDDEIVYAGATIDLGEAAVEQLALGLDPYPRKPGTPPVDDPDLPDQNPFDVLKGRLS